MKQWRKMHWVTLGVIALLWSAGAGALVFHLCQFHMEYFARALATSLLTVAVIVFLHALLLVAMPSPQAVWGMLIAKLFVLPMTLGMGLAVIVFGELGRSGGEIVGAKWAYSSVPTSLAMTAFASLLIGAVGAGVGHMVHLRQRAGAVQQDSSEPPPPWRN